MTANDIINETLRLDAEATKGPWMHDDEAHYIVGDHGPDVADLDIGGNRSGTRIIDVRGWARLYNAFGAKEAERIQRANAAIVCHSRTAAPLLARMLRLHRELAAWIVNPCAATVPPWFDEAMKANGVDPCVDATRYVIAEIERIANGGGV